MIRTLWLYKVKINARTIEIWQSITWLAPGCWDYLLFSCQVDSDSFATPWTVVLQAPLSMGFSKQEYWSGYHFLLQGIFPKQGSNWWILHWQVDFLPVNNLGILLELWVILKRILLYPFSVLGNNCVPFLYHRQRSFPLTQNYQQKWERKILLIYI